MQIRALFRKFTNTLYCLSKVKEVCYTNVYLLWGETLHGFALFAYFMLVVLESPCANKIEVQLAVIWLSFDYNHYEINFECQQLIIRTSSPTQKKT